MDIENLSPAGKMNMQYISEGKKVYEHLKEMSKDPIKYNNETLMNILEINKNTEFGKKFDFENISSIKEFQEKLPISHYDDYVGYILRMIKNNESNLICSSDINHYCMSSGTMGNPKKIPFSVLSQKLNQDYINNYMAALIGEKIGLDWVDGRTFNLIEIFLKTLPNGSTYGAASGKFIADFKEYLNFLFTSPLEAIFPENNIPTKYMHVRFALMDKNISRISSTFSSLILETLRYIESNWELLVNDIENGTIDESIELPPEIKESLLEKIEPMPERAEELRAEFNKGFNTPFIPRIWPNLKLITTIGTASFSNFTEKIQKYYAGDDVYFYLLGYNASEGLFSVPIDLNSPKSSFVADSVFYEFLPLGKDECSSNFLTLDQLEVGQDYEVFITNFSGFYRYAMRDAIRIVDKYNEMPLMEFLYRIDQNVNLVGEKTTEDMLREAIFKTANDLNFNLIDFSVFADVDSSPLKYIYLIEAEDIPEDLSLNEIQVYIEKSLEEANPRYYDKIIHDNIAPLKLELLQAETYPLFRELMVMKGISSAQLKPPRVIVNEIQRKFFFALIER